MLAADAPGYQSEVHTSLLEPVLLFKQVPYVAGLANCLIGLLITVSFQWWMFLIVTVEVHGFLCLLTKHDHQLIEIAVRSLWYARYYEAG
jgi:type IV secretory pathway TrbD component